MKYYVTKFDENLREESQEVREFDGSKRKFAKLLGEQELAKLEAARELVSKISGKRYPYEFKLTVSPNSAVISQTGGAFNGIYCVIRVEEDPNHRWDKLLKDLHLSDE